MNITIITSYYLNLSLMLLSSSLVPRLLTYELEPTKYKRICSIRHNMPSELFFLYFLSFFFSYFMLFLIINSPSHLILYTYINSVLNSTFSLLYLLYYVLSHHYFVSYTQIFTPFLMLWHISSFLCLLYSVQSHLYPVSYVIICFVSTLYRVLCYISALLNPIVLVFLISTQPGILCISYLFSILYTMLSILYLVSYDLLYLFSKKLYSCFPMENVHMFSKEICSCLNLIPEGNMLMFSKESQSHSRRKYTDILISFPK